MKKYPDRVFILGGLFVFGTGIFIDIGFQGKEEYSLAKYIIGYVLVFIGFISVEAGTQAICSKAVSQECMESYWNPGMWMGVADTLGRCSGNFGVFLVGQLGKFIFLIF